MARHKADQDTKRLLSRIDTTREELLGVVTGLGEAGVSRTRIAGTAHWNAGYLSEFLTNSEKKPTAPKVEALIEALGAFVAIGAYSPELTDTLARVAERYGRPLARLANPAVGPVPAGAPNCVHRADIDESLKRSVPYNGSYAIDGQPMTGVSSALLQVEGLLSERGFEVCRLSAGHDLVDSGTIESSKTGVMGALAAAITRSTAPLTLGFYGVQDAIRDHLVGKRDGFALILDDVNRLDTDSTESVKLLLRDWATKRSLADQAFVNTTVWLAYTSNVSRASLRSQFIADYIITRWFSSEEMRNLADALSPFVAAQGVVPSPGQWATDVAATAWNLFEGQPHLTHCFIWDRHNDGTLPDPRGVHETLAKVPEGTYQRHLDRLADSLMMEVSPPRAAVMLEDLASAGRLSDAVTVADRQVADRLGLVNPDGSWRCPYYEAQLLGAFERKGLELGTGR